MKPFIPALIWGTFITWVSVMPKQSLPKIELDLMSPDKLAHAVVYMILVVAIYWGLSKKKQLNTKNIVFAIIFGSFYGILMEVAQYLFFPGRYFEFLDIIANIIGSIASLLFLYFFK